ncbi:hypothetical protein DFQ01_10958 [Paenibacillus cellulosilyticus]|uniref:Uncharacterized protein n=1 Tax=Paenibacillus cellulosilyticus TaxID=375489 RepID=A0A2V2YSS7_9BACL|nr:hypothetical protein [Paenibacillus cellulosilyticus]PWW02433.1 hypothetical protein DFQ01_10958 [Paenibacillus cellulosilyticus]QKS47144.1 hypothetical protein HUB94_22105 [Paenibacillus cellulosilyticus]
MPHYQINDAIETLTPSETQKNKMLQGIQEQLNKQRTRPAQVRGRRIITSIAVCLLALVLSTSVYAATNNQIMIAIKEEVIRIFWADGNSTLVEKTDDNKITVGITGNQSEWLVKEKDSELLLTVNGNTLDITKELSDQGYYFYDYRDQSQKLHRVYIVKNASGKSDSRERWYAQMEWFPELGIGGSNRGLSGPLAVAIMDAEQKAKEGGNLAAELQLSLDQYWEKYGK